ncbi:MAG: Hsp20/alpha crystallin family protein [Gemmataceae bacterium]
MASDTVRFVSFFLTPAADASPEWRPPTDVYRVPGGWLVKMELAGVEPEDIELSSHSRALRVRGRRRDCCVEPDCRQLHMEIAYSRFDRQVELPINIELCRITSEFRHGMLLVRIEREAPR